MQLAAINMGLRKAGLTNLWSLLKVEHNRSMKVLASMSFIWTVKVFDSVQHKRLLEKLKIYGINRKLLDGSSALLKRG